MYSENHAIVAWFKRGYTGKEKTNKKITQNDFVSKAPSERELSAKLTEGECEIIKFARV